VDEDSSDSTTKKKCSKRRWGAKSRWGDSDELEKETVLSGLPTVVPSGLTKEQEEQYLSELLVLCLLCYSVYSFLRALMPLVW